MNFFILIIIFITNAKAGIGDIAGGQNERRIPYHNGTIIGDKVHFQKNSTWVSAAYNRTLCLNNEIYEAYVPQCLKYSGRHDDRHCIKRGKKKIYQPVASKRQRCSNHQDNQCNIWETIDYIQDPVKELKFYDDNNNFEFSKTILIPYCH